MPFTPADVVILAIMLLSGLLALLRGFIREMLTTLSIVLAVFATYWFFPGVSTFVSNYISPAWLSDGLSALTILLVSYAILTFLSTWLVNQLNADNPGPVDGTLGFLFGLARGFVLVSLVYLFFSWTSSSDDPPAWIREARFLPLIDQTNTFFVDLARQFALGEGPPETADRAPGQSGYDSGSRDALDDLIGENR